MSLRHDALAKSEAMLNFNLIFVVAAAADVFVVVVVYFVCSLRAIN